MDEINFTTTRDEMRLIARIADRAVAHGFYPGKPSEAKRDADMDLTAVHCNGTRLCLDDLLHTDTINFAHDIGGIRKHLNRETGQLMELFHPRFAQRDSDQETSGEA